MSWEIYIQIKKKTLYYLNLCVFTRFLLVSFYLPNNFGKTYGFLTFFFSFNFCYYYLLPNNNYNKEINLFKGSSTIAKQIFTLISYIIVDHLGVSPCLVSTHIFLFIILQIIISNLKFFFV